MTWQRLEQKGRLGLVSQSTAFRQMGQGEGFMFPSLAGIMREAGTDYLRQKIKKI